MKLALSILLMVSVCFAKDYSKERRQLVRIIQSEMAYTASYTGKSSLSDRVENAMLITEREKFVPFFEKRFAYDNRPLPIGYGQTISQPYIVALMTEILDLKQGDKVLEVGTGSGYQAAVLSPLVQHVYTIEIIPALGNAAKERFAKLGYENITSKVGDGYYGMKDVAPFDAIIVTAAASHVPPPLVKQLKQGGKMIIPVGGKYSVQNLILIEKKADGVVSRSILPVRFVPLTGKH